MAKIYGLFGSMTGKLADTVMSVRNGEQLARKYQPVVFNPSTPAQVAQRAKLKLMSQLSAVMAPVIAMRREGPVSSRNVFTKVNIRNTAYATDKATIDLLGLKLTSGVVALPSIVASRDSGNINLSLDNSVDLNIDRVVYAMFTKRADNSIIFSGSTVANDNVGHTYPAILPLVSLDADVIVYAYGIRDNTENARVVFGELEVPNAANVAQLITNSTLTASDITLTETRAIESTPGE